MHTWYYLKIGNIVVCFQGAVTDLYLAGRSQVKPRDTGSKKKYESVFCNNKQMR